MMDLDCNTNAMLLNQGIQQSAHDITHTHKQKKKGNLFHILQESYGTVPILPSPCAF